MMMLLSRKNQGVRLFAGGLDTKSNNNQITLEELPAELKACVGDKLFDLEFYFMPVQNSSKLDKLFRQISNYLTF